MKDCSVPNFSNNWIRCLFAEEFSNTTALTLIFKYTTHLYTVAKGCLIKIEKGQLITGIWLTLSLDYPNPSNENFELWMYFCITSMFMFSLNL